MWATRYFGMNKFWPVFSLLFGLGFYFQIRRGNRRRSGFVPVYLRRLLVLFCFGWLCTTVLLGGPVLLRYAVLGMFLLPFGNARPRIVLVCAFLSLILGILAPPLYNNYRQKRTAAAQQHPELASSHAWMAEQRAVQQQSKQWVARWRQIRARGSWAEFTRMKSEAEWRLVTSMRTVGAAPGAAGPRRVYGPDQLPATSLSLLPMRATSRDGVTGLTMR